MACPRCGAPLDLDAAICPACRYAPALGEVVGVLPPRAARPDAVYRIPRAARGAPVRAPWPRWLLLAAGVAPGLGQFLDGRRREGAIYAGAVAILIGVACVVDPASIGLPIGLAASVHAWAWFDLTAWRRHPSFILRIGALLAMQIAIYIVLYRGLAVILVQPLLGQEGGTIRVLAGWWLELGVLAGIAVCLLWLAWWRRP